MERVKVSPREAQVQGTIWPVRGKKKYKSLCLLSGSRVDHDDQTLGLPLTKRVLYH